MLAVALALTVALGFAAGFALARSGSSTSTDTAATVTTTTEGPPSTTALDATSSTVAPSTTEAVTTTESSTTTAAAPTTAVTTPTPAPTTTVAPPPTTSLQPADLSVDYPRDGAGRLVLPAGGSASLVIRNTGGSVGQWLLSGTGFVSANGVTRGQLAPGEQVVAVIGPAPGLPAGTTGTLNVLGVGPAGTLAIPTIVG